MASNYVCRSCMLALRQHQLCFSLRKAPLQPKRLFATSTSAFKQASPQAKIKKSPARSSPETPGPELFAPTTKSPNPNPPSVGGSSKLSKGLAATLREQARNSTETYVAYGATENLFKECARQADYEIKRDKKGNAIGEIQIAEGGEDIGTPLGEGLWYKDFDLPCTFNTWAQITFLHMWLLTARFRLFPAAHAPSWHQHLMDHFSFDAERRMVDYHALFANGIRQRYLKDLFIQWRGCLAAYDEGLIKGDAILAAAIWRNILGARELRDGDVNHITAIVAYVRYCAKALDKLDDGEFAGGSVPFERGRLLAPKP